MDLSVIVQRYMTAYSKPLAKFPIDHLNIPFVLDVYILI